MNSAKPFHEKRRRGRPRTPAVDAVAGLFPETKSRRSDWNHYYAALAINHLHAVLGVRALEDIMAPRGELPLPFTVLHALGVIPAGGLATRLTRACLRRRQSGERAHALAAWVRGEHQRAAMTIAMTTAEEEVIPAARER